MKSIQRNIFIFRKFISILNLKNKHRELFFFVFLFFKIIIDDDNSPDEDSRINLYSHVPTSLA